MEYSVSDVANMLGVGNETVRRWIRDGKLVAKRARGRNGSEITLEDVVNFANRPPCFYLEALRSWLNEHNITYDEDNISVVENKTSEKGDIISKLAAIGGLSTAAALINPTTIYTTVKYPQIRLRSDSTKGELNKNIDLKISSENETPSEKELNDMIREEKLKLIQLKQAKTEIEAKINICERQIEYYKIMLEK